MGSSSARIKEIGIRKVLHASVSNIEILFIKDFVGVIAVAGLVAFPLAWLVMHNWLNNLCIPYSYNNTTIYIFCVNTCIYYLVAYNASDSKSQ